MAKLTDAERIRTRRAQIIEAAVSLFSKKGFHNATTKEIAAEAGVSEGTLYNYFADKHDLLLSIAQEASYPETALLEAANPGNREAMIAIFERAIELTITERPFVQTVMSAAYMDDELAKEFITLRTEKARNHLRGLLDQSVAAGILHPVDTEMVARLILSMLIGLRMPGGLPTPFSADQRHNLAQTAVDLILDGIRPREA
jgi:AcrR family transcriptional regulator